MVRSPQKTTPLPDKHNELWMVQKLYFDDEIFRIKMLRDAPKGERIGYTGPNYHLSCRIGIKIKNRSKSKMVVEIDGKRFTIQYKYLICIDHFFALKAQNALTGNEWPELPF